MMCQDKEFGQAKLGLLANEAERIDRKVCFPSRFAWPMEVPANFKKRKSFCSVETSESLGAKLYSDLKQKNCGTGTLKGIWIHEIPRCLGLGIFGYPWQLRLLVTAVTPFCSRPGLCRFDSFVYLLFSALLADDCNRPDCATILHNSWLFDP